MVTCTDPILLIKLKIMNVLLLKAEGLTSQNNAVTPPLGLMYLASYLKGKHPSINIKIVDTRVANSKQKEFKKLLEDFHPDITGISAVTMEANSMHELAGIVKKTVPDCKVIAGGPHPTSFLEKTLRDTNIDFVVRGEGELTFEELVETIKTGGNIKGVKGIAFRENGEFINTEQREYISDLDSIPFPAWDMVDIDVYSRYTSMSTRGRRRYMVIFTSRSCPYRCIYCHNMFGKGFRARSPENVIEEIDILYSKYEIRELEIIDDIFNLNVNRAERICDLIIERGYDLKIAFPNGLRSDRLDRRLLEKLRKSGTVFISFAVESASQRIQKLIKKNLNLEKVKEAINTAVELGIFSNGFFMLGFPTETEEEIKETIRFALESNLHTAYFFIVTPFESTELYEMCREMLKKEINFIDYSYCRSYFNLSEVPDKKLVRIQRIAYLRFYFSPSRIFSIFFSYVLNDSKLIDILYYFWATLKKMSVRIFK